MPTVSVVIPTYNRAHTILRAIESVLGQTFTDLEVLVIDDGSTDRTDLVVGSIADSRLRYIRFDVNRERSAARNAGIREARGEYIAFLDSDDEWMPEKLTKQLDLLEKRSFQWAGAYCGVIIDKGHTTCVQTAVSEGELFEEFLLGRVCFWAGSTLLVRKTCIDEEGAFDEGLTVFEDMEFTGRLLRKFKLAAVPEPLAVVHSSGRHLTADMVNEGKRKLLHAFGPDIESMGPHKSRYIRAVCWMDVSAAYFREGGLAKGCSYLRKAAALMPLLPSRYYLRTGRSLFHASLARLLRRASCRSEPAAPRSSQESTIRYGQDPGEAAS